jgi:hypothetical protein
VLSIGLPFSNPLSDFVFVPLRIFGIDVSMTPLTVDMSMMSDAKNVPIYRTDLRIKVFSKDGGLIDLKPSDLNLYLHKLPIILYYEILGQGGDMPEGRVFLCRSFEKLLNKKISSFLIWTDIKHAQFGFNQNQECPH